MAQTPQLLTTGEQDAGGVVKGVPVDMGAVQRYVRRGLTTNASGVWSGALPRAGLALFITPRTEGAIVSSIVENGATVTITFKKLNTGGLGLTLGTLLSATILAASVGAITFDLAASEPTA